jgi:RNA polymerase sigma-70 factor (ECF subfamily)
VIEFETPYERHAGAVFRFALSRSGDRALAEDITSETFVRLWTARARVDIQTVAGYLLTIARHLYLQGVSMERRRQSQGAPRADEAGGAAHEPGEAAAMNVTREIVKDLLPLYVAGEASPDTRALVESILRDDAELVRLADALRAEKLAGPRGSSAPPGAARAALLRTQDLLRRRTWFLALALFFSGLPLSFVAGDSGLRFLLIRDAPALGSASLAVAVALWIAYAVNARRLRVTGL